MGVRVSVERIEMKTLRVWDEEEVNMERTTAIAAMIDRIKF